MFPVLKSQIQKFEKIHLEYNQRKYDLAQKSRLDQTHEQLLKARQLQKQVLDSAIHWMLSDLSPARTSDSLRKILTNSGLRINQIQNEPLTNSVIREYNMTFIGKTSPHAFALAMRTLYRQYPWFRIEEFYLREDENDVMSFRLQCTAAGVSD